MAGLELEPPRIELHRSLLVCLLTVTEAGATHSGDRELKRKTVPWRFRTRSAGLPSTRPAIPRSGSAAARLRRLKMRSASPADGREHKHSRHLSGAAARSCVARYRTWAQVELDVQHKDESVMLLPGWCGWQRNVASRTLSAFEPGSQPGCSGAAPAQTGSTRTLRMHLSGNWSDTIITVLSGPRSPQLTAA